jgi:DNA invertase Pin-like site-specific DNA recombinase
MIEALTKNDEILNQNFKPEDYAASYARHSIDKKESVSNEVQFSICREIAKKSNLIIYDEYGDQGTGLTVAPERRVGFQKLLADAKAGFFKSVIIWKIDRFSRNPDDFFKTKDMLEAYGVKLIFGDMLFLDSLPTHVKEFMQNTFISLSYLEPNKIKERANQSRKLKREAGIYPSSKTPFGYIANKSKDFLMDKELLSLKVKTYYEKEPFKSRLVEVIFNTYVSLDNINIKEIYKGFQRLSEYFIRIEDIKDKNDFLGELEFIIDNMPETVLINIKSVFRSLLYYEVNTDEDMNNIKSLIKESITFLSKHNSITSIIKGIYYCKYTPIKNAKTTKLLATDDNGELVFNEEEFVQCINFDKIISLDKYVAANKKLISSNFIRNINSNFLYKGLLKCSKCKTKLSSIDSKSYTCKCNSYNKIDLISMIISELIKDGFVDYLSSNVKLKIDDIDITVNKIKNDIKLKEQQRYKATIYYLENTYKANATEINNINEEIEILKESLQKFLLKDYPFRVLLDELEMCKSNSIVINKLLVDYFNLNSNIGEIFLKQLIKLVTINNGGCRIEYN